MISKIVKYHKIIIITLTDAGLGLLLGEWATADAIWVL